jgi:hypothetical protein
MIATWQKTAMHDMNGIIPKLQYLLFSHVHSGCFVIYSAKHAVEGAPTTCPLSSLDAIFKHSARASDYQHLLIR